MIQRRTFLLFSTWPRISALVVGILLTLAVALLSGGWSDTERKDVSLSGEAEDSARLVFTLRNRTFHDEQLHGEASFILLDNGKFRFETTTGGFHLCNDAPAGDFSGRMDAVQMAALIDAFMELDDACEELDGCSRRRGGDRTHDHDWSVLGWGRYAEREYYLTGGPLPDLFQRIFALEKGFYDDPERALALRVVEQTPERLLVSARYQGDEPYPFIISPQAFLLFSDDGSRRRLAGETVEIRTLKNGESTTFTLNTKRHQIEDGDALVYTGQGERKLNPCAIVGNT